jgi:asparagine synthase (glutamine-hydrolysing)
MEQRDAGPAPPDYVVAAPRMEPIRGSRRAEGRMRYVGHAYLASMLFPRASYFDAINTYCTHSHPYFDPRLVGFAFSCPPHVHHDYTKLSMMNPYPAAKRLAREAYADVLPECATRKEHKTSYALMARKMLLNSRDAILDMVAHPMLTARWGLIDQASFRRHLLAYLIVTEDPNVRLGARYHYVRGVIDLENWLRRLSGTRADLIERIRFRPPRRFGEGGA